MKNDTRTGVPRHPKITTILNVGPRQAPRMLDQGQLAPGIFFPIKNVNILDTARMAECVESGQTNEEKAMEPRKGLGHPRFIRDQPLCLNHQENSVRFPHSRHIPITIPKHVSLCPIREKLNRERRINHEPY